MLFVFLWVIQPGRDLLGAPSSAVENIINVRENRLSQRRTGYHPADYTVNERIWSAEWADAHADSTIGSHLSPESIAGFLI